MPNVNCCVPYCCADSKRHRGLRFYTLPKDLERRQAWIILIRNINLRTASRYTSVCSLHFPGGSKTYDTKDPSIFPWSPLWPAIVQEYNNRQKVVCQIQNDLDPTNTTLTPDLKKNRPMTLRIPPMCPWASQFNDISSNKNLHDFYSPKTLQVDPDLQGFTSNSATNVNVNDLFSIIEAECRKIKNEPLEPIRSTHENKPDISLIEDKTNLSSTMNNKNLNSLDFYSPSPLSSELLMQSPMNNNDLHSTLFSSSATENQITHEFAQTEAEIRRRTLLMSDHYYNRKIQREVQKDVLASSTCGQIFQRTSQAYPTDDFHQNLQIQAKKNLPTGWNYWPDLEYNFSSY